MRRKSNKKSLRKYTALIPKTVKATKNLGTTAINKISYFFTSATRRLSKFSKTMDKKTAKTIRSFTKRRVRK
jgi:hypothetical protein